MSDQLDRIETQQATNTANIADLITVSDNLIQAAQINTEAIARLEAVTAENAAAIAELRTNTEIIRIKSAETDERFNILIAEMRADRQALNSRIDGLEAS